jgi:FkbM family methyltransferase
MLDTWAHRWRETRTYATECRAVADFGRLMRIRLSQSKMGPLVTPKPIVMDVSLRRFGRVRLRSHTTDISVLSELLIGDEIGGLPEMPDARTVVDLGANTGLSYRWLRDRYPLARFVCVEPDPGNLEMLRFNAGQGCRIVGACIGGYERSVSLSGDDGEWGYRMIAAADGAIAVITMQRLLADAGVDEIDVLKCDIEGAEAELFAECRPWIGRVRTMNVECHHHTIDADGLIGLLDANDAGMRVTHRENHPEFGFDLVALQRNVSS